MAWMQWNWSKALPFNALLLAGLFMATLLAGPGGGWSPRHRLVAGRLRASSPNVRSVPLAGAAVVARNEATGAEARTTTARNGSYRFTGLAAGEYSLEAQSKELGRGRLDGIFVADGHEARVQAAMEFELPAPGANETASAPDETGPARDNAAAAQIQPAPRPVILAESDPSIETASLPLVELDDLALIDIPNHLPVRAALHAVPAETPQVTTAVAAEPMLSIPIAGQGLPKPPQPASGMGSLAVNSPPAIAQPAGTTALAIELKGPEWGPGGELENDPTLSEVADAARRTAILLARLKAKPAAPAAVEPSSDPVAPVVTTIMTGAELKSLPVSGRQWQNFVLDAPTSATVAGGEAQSSLRGAGQEPIETTVDGVSTMLAFGGQGASESGSQTDADQGGMGRAWASGRGFAIAESAIREVQTVAGNVAMEGSRAGGGRMNVETERGENGLHGQAFLFDRQNTWGAQNPFTQWVKETTPATETAVPVFTAEPYTPPDHELTWGLGAGGQILRDKLFWFAALDHLDRNDPGLSMVKHPYLCADPPQCNLETGFFAQPSNDQMQVLAARLGLPASNPVAEGLAAYSNLLEALAGLLGPAPRTAAQWAGFSRIDWKVSERNQLTLEGIGAAWNSPGGGLSRVSETYGSNSFGSSQASQELLLGRWEGFVTPNLLFATQGSIGRSIQSARPEAPSAFEQPFLAPMCGASCRRSWWTRATDSRLAIRRGLGRGVILTSTLLEVRSQWTGYGASFWSRAASNSIQRRHNQSVAQSDWNLFLLER